MAKKETTKEYWTGGKILKTTWRAISIGISTLLLLFFGMIFINVFSSFVPESLAIGNVAVIPIEGMISTESDSWMPGIKSADIVEQIEKADKNDEIKAILLMINSPGGSPVATDEIAQALKDSNKTTVAVIRETGASGAYWIATAADKIFANRMSMTGSIGVTASRLEYWGILKDYNITYRKLTAGRLKDAGTVFREMTLEEQQLFQTLLNDLDDEFIKAVAENRQLPEEKVRELATGFVYLGSEAKELGLVDELGGKKEALKYLEKELNITAEPVEYGKKTGFFETLSGLTAQNFYHMGKGIGSSFSTDTKVSLT
jgi:protease-4